MHSNSFSVCSFKEKQDSSHKITKNTFSEFPCMLKEGKVCPVHTGRSRTDTKNDKPIAMTSHVIKVMLEDG